MRLFIATGNTHKTAEIRTMLGEGITVEDLSNHLDMISPEETGDTFLANAEIKAVAASDALPDRLVLADDSGLEVDALGGNPGVWSARYAGPEATDADNRELLKKELKALHGAQSPYTARFRCVMVLAVDGEVLANFDGTVEGQVLLQEEGEGGFGYDPLFLPDGYSHTFGVLPAEVKNQLSHRALALQKVAAWLRSHDTYRKVITEAGDAPGAPAA